MTGVWCDYLLALGISVLQLKNGYNMLLFLRLKKKGRERSFTYQAYGTTDSDSCEFYIALGQKGDARNII
jgi:hypothetical protein